MGEYILKNIEMTLDEGSIEKALKEIEDFRSRLQPAMQCLIDYLGEKGVEVARAELLWVGGTNTGGGESGNEPVENEAYATGRLSESIKYVRTEDGAGEVQAGEGLTNAMGEPTNYAIYVEYGNGYTRPDGWWYPDPNGWWEKNGQTYSWTNGMPPRPFMAHTLHDLEEEAVAQGGRVIAEYIRGERA